MDAMVCYCSANRAFLNDGSEHYERMRECGTWIHSGRCQRRTGPISLTLNMSD